MRNPSKNLSAKSQKTSHKTTAKKKEEEVVLPEDAKPIRLARSRSKAPQAFQDLAAITGAGSTFTKNG